MRNPTSAKAVVLGALSLLVLASAAWAIKITLFMDTQTFTARAKHIVIADVVDISADDGGDGLYPVNIEIVMILKGDKLKGKAKLATIYHAEKGHRYLVSSIGGLAFGTDLLAVPELSLVEVPADMNLHDLEGKPLNEQVSAIFRRRLDDVRTIQARLAEEKALLEKAVPTTNPAKP